jgi:ABC-type Mn2+/Zn2+ transport system permease subunit
MELWERIKKYESLHIVFWLIKDSCWMLELKWLGIIMVIPTLIIAAIIVYITLKTTDVFLNLAILFWICANSFWMYIEFFTTGERKLWASIPFSLGFIFVAIYYYKTLISNSSPNKK